MVVLFMIGREVKHLMHQDNSMGQAYNDDGYKLASELQTVILPIVLPLVADGYSLAEILHILRGCVTFDIMAESSLQAIALREEHEKKREQ